MNKVIIVLFILIIIYGLYNSQNKNNQKVEKDTTKQSVITPQDDKLKRLKDELKELNDLSYLKRYIIDVINKGSYNLGFKGGVMEGGFVAPEDATKIACFVVEMSGKNCPSPYPTDAQMFYTSVCGGCHGDDGKGIGGTYPDLTKKKLLGIKKREEYLKTEIFRMQRVEE